MDNIKEKLVNIICGVSDLWPNCDAPTGDCHGCHEYADALISRGVTIQQEQFRDVPKMVTNADRIRAMSDEELAREFKSYALAIRCCSESAWLAWLQQSAEEG